MLGVGSDKALLRIPSDLPILITGGEDDAVGGDDGLGKLMLHYAQTLHQRLKIKIYEGGRHEMLFETNRDEVVKDLIDWLDAIGRRSIMRSRPPAPPRDTRTGAVNCT